MDRHKTSVTITVRITRELRERIYTLARKSDITPNAWVGRTLNREAFKHTNGK